MFKVKAITAFVVTGIFGLAACGGGSGDKDDSPVTTVRQKNAALSPTTLPQTTAPKTVTTLKPVLGGSTVSSSTTIAPRATTTVVPAAQGKKNITVTSPAPSVSR